MHVVDIGVILPAVHVGRCCCTGGACCRLEGVMLPAALLVLWWLTGVIVTSGIAVACCLLLVGGFQQLRGTMFRKLRHSKRLDMNVLFYKQKY